jgi:predicted nucleic acid-binding protein
VLLVDTSVWIEVFKKDSRVKLEAVAPLEEIALCPPVFQEVLQGFRDEKEPS